jgi:hypothetical protein
VEEFRGPRTVFLSVNLVILLLMFGLAGAQGLPVRGGLDLTPTNPLAMQGLGLADPQGSAVATISSGMFPGLFSDIPNLEVGFVYNFGRNVRQGRGVLDYLIPVDVSPATTVFGEFHGEFEDFWKRPADRIVARPGNATSHTMWRSVRSRRRFDLSLGGGLRKLLGSGSVLGVNGFFDTSRINERWYSSGGLGLEAACLLPGDGFLDLNFNYYGNLFSTTNFVNAFRYGSGNFDIEAGYSQPVFDGAADLRLKAVGYQFDIGSKVYGWRVGADLTSRNGLLRARYEYTQDRINEPYHSVAAYVNVGFQLENLLRGENPFSTPDPVFDGPRNLRRVLHARVKRNWHQPSIVIGRTVTASEGRRLILVSVYRGPVGSGALTVDVANNAWVVHTGGAAVFNDFAYRFRMSDNSIQDVRITVTLTAGAYDVSFGYSGGGFSRGPAPMNAVTADTAAMFGPVAPGEYHWGDGAGNGSGFVTLDVPGDPSIAPLVIRFRFINP